MTIVPICNLCSYMVYVSQNLKYQYQVCHPVTIVCWLFHPHSAVFMNRQAFNYKVDYGNAWCAKICCPPVVILTFLPGFYGRPWTPEQRKDLFVK